MNEDEISETLNRVVPNRDVPEGVLAGARRRRRRTRIATGGAAVALVTALTLSLGLTMGSSNKNVVATPAPSPSTNAAPAQLEPEACRDAAATTLPENQMPDGAVRVWLCGGPSDSFGGTHYVGAPEPLTSSVADAVAAFNAVPSAVGVMSCTPNNSIGYTVVYEYPDGAVQTVEGSLGGCEAVLSSGTHRGDARGYLEALRGLWNDQRSTLGTVFDADVEVCSSRTSVMGVEIADMTRAYACGPIEGGDPAKDSVQIPLSDELVADIVKEIGPRDGMAGILPGVTMAAPSLVFLSEEGDPLTILGSPEGYRWYDPEPTGMNQWVPSAGLAARIYDEVTRDGVCTAPPRLVPADVKVDVYDAGGGAASVALVKEHLTKAGFDVTNTGESAFQSLGAPIITRASLSNDAAMRLVGAQFTGAGGEMSREDDVVDVLVTPLFNEGGEHFSTSPPQDVANGTLTCKGTPVPSAPSAQSTPSTIPSSRGLPSSENPKADDKCERDAESRMTPSDLPGNTLAQGPVAVWLCDGTGSPPEPLVGEQAMQQVVDSFRALPTSSTGGRFPMPNHAYVLVDYADGERYIIEVDTNASFEVRWGSERQHIRYGGNTWFTQLTDLWRKQRDVTPQNPPLLASVDNGCDQALSALQRTIDHHDEAAMLCGTDPTTGASLGSGLLLGQELAKSIGKDALATSVAWPEGKILDWTGEVVALIDDYGEQLRMLHTADDTWLWSDPSGQWQWTPSPDLATRLTNAFDQGKPSPDPTHS